jgi:myo-inositol-1(or 4)-monophosphatase
MSYSDPYINTIFLACRKTSKSLIRDFGEVEKLQVSLKGVSDFVSLADTKAEKMLIKELTYSYPKINILAEETGVIKNSDESIRWIIDPLDGTSNFVFSIPHFAISIALEKNNEVIVGGVYQPLTDEFFWAVKGRGAYCNNLRLRVSSKENLQDCMIGTGIPHKGMKGHEEYVPGLKQVMEKVCGIRRFGAASLDLAYVAAGKFDGYWEKNLKLVDIAAGWNGALSIADDVTRIRIGVYSPCITCGIRDWPNKGAVPPAHSNSKHCRCYCPSRRVGCTG